MPNLISSSTSDVPPTTSAPGVRRLHPPRWRRDLDRRRAGTRLVERGPRLGPSHRRRARSWRVRPNSYGRRRSARRSRRSAASARRTPASSQVDVPTSRSGCETVGSPASTFARSPGPIFPAHPAARARSVKRNGADDMVARLVRAVRAVHRSSTQSTHVADAGRDAGAIAPVEQRDGELARSADQVAEDRRRDLAVRFAVSRQPRLRLRDGLAAEPQVGRDPHASLLLEHAEHLRIRRRSTFSSAFEHARRPAA